MESHLLQMRGLKLKPALVGLTGPWVASFTDAWIETKFENNGKLFLKVASFTDAWIETKDLIQGGDPIKVASFTDAWIETTAKLKVLKTKRCRIFYRCVD